MGGDELAVPVLVGLGMDRLSMNFSSVDENQETPVGNDNTADAGICASRNRNGYGSGGGRISSEGTAMLLKYNKKYYPDRNKRLNRDGNQNITEGK